MKFKRQFIFLISAIFFLSSKSIFCEELCRKMRHNWEKVQSYQCIYKATTFHEGKKTETVMRYSFRKPDKIRMDIEKPRKGAVLIYNPEISPKVKVRPFSNLSFFVLNYNLTDQRVSSDSGGTIDRSDLGHRIELFCKTLEKNGSRKFSEEDKEILLPYESDGGKMRRKYFIGQSGLIEKIETLNEKNICIESFEWQEIRINSEFDSAFFTKF